MNKIVSMTMIGPCEISSPSPKFFGAPSKFPDVPLFRPNLFIKGDSRTGPPKKPPNIKPPKKPFVMVTLHCSVQFSSVQSLSPVRLFATP